MKFGLVIRPDKKNTAALKKLDNEFMSAIRNVIVLFLIYGQFSAIHQPNHGCAVYKTYNFN